MGDRKEPIHILSADSRFPDVKPGEQLSSGNHFMVLFPEDLINAVNREQKKMRRRKKSAGVRGGGCISESSVAFPSTVHDQESRTSKNVSDCISSTTTDRRRKRKSQHDRSGRN